MAFVQAAPSSKGIAMRFFLLSGQGALGSLQLQFSQSLAIEAAIRALGSGRILVHVGEINANADKSNKLKQSDSRPKIT